MKTVSDAHTALMTQGDIKRRMLFFAIPVLIGNLFQQLYNTVDSLIVGNYLGAQALAAVASTGSLIYMIIGFFNGLAMGAGTVIARDLGARDDDAASAAVHTAIALGLLCGVAVSVAGYFYAEPILRLMGSPDDVLSTSARYLRLYFAGSFSVIMYNVFVGILQASGDSRHPLYYLVASSILNVGLDVLCIAGLGMGVEGAAIATVISQTCSMILAAVRLSRSEGAIRMYIGKIRFDGERLRRVLQYGLPTGAQTAIIDFSNVLIQSFINSFGSAAMAGLGAFTKIEGFAFLPVTAFQMAISTFVSQNVGGREYERARKGIVFGVSSTVILSEIVGLCVFVFGRQLLGLFADDPEVIRYGMLRATICAPLMLMPAYSHAMSAVMRGIGKPMTPMVVMLTCWCAVRVLVLYTVGQVWHDIRLVCWVYPFTWFLSTTVYTLYAVRLRREIPWLRGKKIAQA